MRALLGSSSGLELDFHAAAKDGVFTQFLLDAQKLVVLRDTIAAAHGDGLDLTAVRRDGEVGDGVAVSYTHLDVYKRQAPPHPNTPIIWLKPSQKKLERYSLNS